MRTLLVINIVWSLLMVALSHFLATQNALAFYPETLPTTYQAGIAAGLAFLGLVLPFRRVRFGLLAASGTALACLIVPCRYALRHWPGGDDGGAFGWILIMGGASLLSILVAICTCCIGLWFLLRGPKKRANPDSALPDMTTPGAAAVWSRGTLAALVTVYMAVLPVQCRNDMAGAQAQRFAEAFGNGTTAVIDALVGPRNADTITLGSQLRNASATVAPASLQDVLLGRRFVSVHVPKGERLEDYDWDLVYRVTATRATLVCR